MEIQQQQPRLHWQALTNRVTNLLMVGIGFTTQGER